ncbi:DUF262 domain-containing protein [Vibrio fluvialis]|uniref:DUF262 domain-containing protein n=1 Tax=Vibrio fluvialis TaxID=676 RepID=UPI001F194CC4|nr:DUF262 domain-containing protein [Vibrio fluvialis]MCE7656941.1 DUF262 domain-containing protein [Vibrio fluvialis]
MEQQIINYFGNEEEQNENSYPMNEFQLTTTPNDFNVSTIISFIQSNVFKIPAFQRHYVWDIKRASKLIESLLIGLPIPQIFLYQQGKNEFLVIDGQQRLMTLYYFFNGRFPKKEKRSALREIFDEFGHIPAEVMADDEYFQKFNLKFDTLLQNQKNRFEGLNYQTLGEHKITLDLSTIRNMVIKPIAEDDEGQAMFEIFNRLNSGGMNLTQQEIRMSMYHSNFNRSLLKLNNDPKWRELLGKPVEDLRLSDVEAILRAFAMLCYSGKYKNSISGFLNSFADHTKNFNEAQIMLLKNIWFEFMNACKNLTDNDFKTGGNRLSITLFESVFFAACSDSWNSGQIDIKPVTQDYLRILKSDASFIEDSTGKTTRKESVTGRIQRAYDLLKG